MKAGRLMCPFSLVILVLLATIHQPLFGQTTPDVESNRQVAISPGDSSTISPLSKTAINGIDSVSSHNSWEGYDRVWQMTGPFGGDVTALSIDPRNADIILLGTNDGQIYRSKDGGEIWRRIRPGINASGFIVTAILFDYEKPGIIYAGVRAVTLIGEQTKGGSVFVSEDNGENWREFEGMHGRAVRGLVQSVKDPAVLVAATLDGVYRTMNRGQSWERITPANDPELRGFHSVALDPRDVDIIYVGTIHLPWKTHDGGRTWKLAGNKVNGVIEDSDIMAIHIDEANPDTVLMSACSGIYRSLDASATWTKIQGIPYTSRRTHVIYQHPTKPEVIFAGTTEGLWLSTNGGKPDSWQRVTSLRLVINAVAIHPARPDRVFLGTQDRGVLISIDGGESYDASNAGFISRQVRTVMADYKERGRVYSGVIFDSVNSGVFISENGGLTWQQSMGGMGVRDVYSLLQSPAKPETIYAGTNHGLFRSDDQGRNWTAVKKEEIKAEVRETIMPAQLRADPSLPPDKARPRRVKRLEEEKSVKRIVQSRVKASNGKNPNEKRRPGSQRNNDSKAIKKPVPQGSDLVDLESQVYLLLPFIPVHEPVTASNEPPESQPQPAIPPTWLIASTWDGLFRTDDEKKGWKEIKLRSSVDGKTVLSSWPRISAIATSPHAPGLIYIGTEDGLFISRDNGESFKRVVFENQALRVRCLAFDPRTAETLYIGASTGFFRSTDGGLTWENRGGGMPLLSDVGAIVISSTNPDELYASDDLRGGFYHSKDTGKNWVKLDISQLPSTKFWSLASDPFDRERLYLGSYSGGVYVMSKR